MKQKSQCQRVLDVLADHRTHSMEEIHERAGFMRLNSRVSELRSRGYLIVCERRGGSYLYRLVGNVNDIPSSGAQSFNGESTPPPGSAKLGAPVDSIAGAIPSPTVEAADVSEREEEFSWSVVGDGQLSMETV